MLLRLRPWQPQRESNRYGDHRCVAGMQWMLLLLLRPSSVRFAALGPAYSLLPMRLRAQLLSRACAPLATELLLVA